MLVKFNAGETKPKNLTCSTCGITEATVRVRWYTQLPKCDDCDDRFLTEKDM